MSRTSEFNGDPLTVLVDDLRGELSSLCEPRPMRHPYCKVSVEKTKGVDDSPKGSELLISWAFVRGRVLLVNVVVPVPALLQGRGIQLLDFKFAGLVNCFTQGNETTS